VQLVDARGVRLAKSDAPDAPADFVGRSPLVQAALAGRRAASFGTLGDPHSPTSPPSRSRGRRRAWSSARSRRAPARRARRPRPRAEGAEVAFYVLPRGRGARGSPRRRWRRRGARGRGGRAAGESRRGRRDGGAAGAAAGAPAEVAIDGTRYLARAHPLRSAAGRVLGGYAVLRSRDVEYAAFEALRRATLVAGGVGLLAALLVSSAIARQVTRPLAALAEAARRAASGDYSASFAVRAGRDEVGTWRPRSTRCSTTCGPSRCWSSSRASRAAACRAGGSAPSVPGADHARGRRRGGRVDDALRARRRAGRVRRARRRRARRRPPRPSPTRAGRRRPVRPPPASASRRRPPTWSRPPRRCGPDTCSPAGTWSRR
jgi:HAMP domain-containing protein